MCAYVGDRGQEVVTSEPPGKGEVGRGRGVRVGAGAIGLACGWREPGCAEGP